VCSVEIRKIVFPDVIIIYTQNVTTSTRVNGADYPLSYTAQRTPPPSLQSSQHSHTSLSLRLFYLQQLFPLLQHRQRSQGISQTRLDLTCWAVIISPTDRTIRISSSFIPALGGPDPASSISQRPLPLGPRPSTAYQLITCESLSSHHGHPLEAVAVIRSRGS
jgi:hypothetical protein